MTNHPIKSPRKLIEVALPLDAINKASREEKAVPRHGHPQTLHYWWARRPLAAARAVIFAQLVNDPGYQQGGGFRYGRNKTDAAIERKRLFKIMEDLVLWENTTNEEVLDLARAEIRRSWREECELNSDHPQAADLFNPEVLPVLHDPFSGGGTIPLEAQRLGLKASASDLNPVAVLISKAMIEIPPRFYGHVPVGPVALKARSDSLTFEKTWPGATGLAEDVRRYGEWVLAEATNRIGHLYPSVEITSEMARERPDLKAFIGEKLNIIASLWARTVASPNPAFAHVQVPLATTFMLSVKEGKEVFIEPIVSDRDYRFTVKLGKPTLSKTAQHGTKLTRANFTCLMSGTPIAGSYIMSEGKAGRIGARMMAMVAETPNGRVYLPPTLHCEEQERAARPSWKPDVEFFQSALGFRIGNYGMSKWSELFTNRQLVALTTFADLISEVREQVKLDALAAGLPDNGAGIDAGASGATAYAEAVSVYLACVLSRLASYNNTFSMWNMKGGSVAQIFGRQAISMSWDFIEINPLEKMSGNWTGGIGWVSDVLENLSSTIGCSATQQDATTLERPPIPTVFSTDPPYYDNIGYADLSDFFYVWLRHVLRGVFPSLFATVTAPKAEELVATPARHGGRQPAEAFFLDGMTHAMQRIAEHAHPSFPLTIYYAFKQAETDDDQGTSSTGWETFLDAVLRAGFAINGTWPMRTERDSRLRGQSANALASSIVLVCRKRPADARSISRRQFIRELNGVLPESLDEMTKGSSDERSPVAPVDLSQAIIGPGMAVFSKYAAVLEADGTPMTVKTALQLINRFLAEDDFDGDTQFCLHWFEQHGWEKARFGEADTLARAKGTSVDGVKAAGVVESGGGNVRLLKWKEYPADWNPSLDTRLPVWEALHQLIRAYSSKGDAGAGKVLKACAGKAEAARQLAYRLYTLCERKGWAEDARAYNEVVTGWSGIERAAGAGGEEQRELFDG